MLVAIVPLLLAVSDGSAMSSSSSSLMNEMTARSRVWPLRTNNIKFLSFYGNGNAEEVSQSDRTTLLNVHANAIATNNLTVCEQAWHAQGVKCILTVDWVWTHSPSALNASLAADAAPLIAAGGIAVLFLGDEPPVGSEANLARVANAARASLDGIDGGDNVLIYMNHCGSGLKHYNITRIPGSIDVMSLDGYCVYDLSDPKCDPSQEAGMMRGIYESGLLPKMQPHQMLFVVPGMFNAGNTSGHSLAEQQHAMVEKLRGYVAWANQEPRIIGIFPWHLEDFACPVGAGDCLGATHFPEAMAVVREIGRNISLQTPALTHP
eukprot:SAG31_NODE_392_length_16294_cov_17.221241_5_plen_321_part_00